MKRRTLAISAGVALLLTTLAVVYVASWRVRGNVQTLLRSGPANLAVAYERGDASIAFTAGGLRLAGDLYRPQGNGPHPGLVLAHGSSPWGRKLGLYRVLARKLAERGYVVAAIDLRGYGDSEDPPAPLTVVGMDSRPDISAAVSYLLGLPGVDPQRIYAVGHSFGAGVVMSAAAGDPRIRKVVAIGPPRRTLDRARADILPLRDRYSHDRRLAELAAPEVFRAFLDTYAIDHLMAYYADPGHVPLFLLDGTLEDREDRRFLADYFAELAEPKRHWTVTGTAHYLNTVGFWGSPLVLYDRKLMNAVADEIDAWLRSPQQPSGGPSGTEAQPPVSPGSKAPPAPVRAFRTPPAGTGRRRREQNPRTGPGTSAPG